jgi:hypothetical protein
VVASSAPDGPNATGPLQHALADDHPEAVARLDHPLDRVGACRCFERAGLRGVDAVLLEERLESGGLVPVIVRASSLPSLRKV